MFASSIASRLAEVRAKKRHTLPYMEWEEPASARLPRNAEASPITHRETATPHPPQQQRQPHKGFAAMFRVPNNTPINGKTQMIPRMQIAKDQ